MGNRSLPNSRLVRVSRWKGWVQLISVCDKYSFNHVHIRIWKYQFEYSYLYLYLTFFCLTVYVCICMYLFIVNPNIFVLFNKWEPFSLVFVFAKKPGNKIFFLVIINIIQWHNFTIFIRPGRSQGLFYKHLRHSLIDLLFQWSFSSEDFTAPPCLNGWRKWFQL